MALAVDDMVDIVTVTAIIAGTTSSQPTLERATVGRRKIGTCRATPVVIGLARPLRPSAVPFGVASP